jgi:hypothetical protein
MKEPKPKVSPPAPSSGSGAGADSTRDEAADSEREPMDEAKARKALHKIAEVEAKLEPRG